MSTTEQIRDLTWELEAARSQLDAARRELAELEAEVRYEFNLQNPDDFGPAIARALRRGES